MTLQRVTVIGSGSVGLAIAATFALVGTAVTLLARGSSVDRLRHDGIKVTGVRGDHTIGSTAITIEDADRPSAASLSCDVIVVATKAYQVADFRH